MRKFVWILLLTVFSIGGTIAQDKTVKEFYALFEEIEFEVLPVYTFGRHPETFGETSLYPFKGKKLDRAFYPILEGLVESIDTELKYSSLYTISRFYISGDLEALLLREYHDGGSEHHIHYVVFDNQKQILKEGVKLAYSYGYEGSSGNTESWILDINKDGYKDILSRSWTESYSGADADYYYEDSFKLLLWTDQKLEELFIDDSTLELALIEDFPFYREPKVSYHTEKGLAAYLKKTTGQEINEHKNGNWCIIAGADTNLELAKYEIERAKKIFGVDYKYGIDSRLFCVYQKGKKYYTIIDDFSTRNEAEIALNEIRKRFNKTAYILDFEEWCLNKEYRKGYYYQCKD